jgi:hypothetical protein
MRRTTKLAIACLGAGAAGLWSAAPVRAETVNEALANKVLLGIDKTDGSLVHYDFNTNTRKTIGTVRDSGGNPMLGIDAAAYFPGLTHIYALWPNPTDQKNKLVYVDAKTAVGVVVNSDVEGGVFTGAASISTATSPYTVFAVQVQKVKPPVTITGSCNINPNNNDDNEFSVKTSTGTTYTRDDLHAASNLPATGTYYEGPAVRVHLKPKGSGNQNTLSLDGQPYALQNSNTYDFEGQMQVRVYNDNPKNGKAMGHWWVAVTGTVNVNGVQVEFPNRLTKIDQRDGTVTELMILSREYSSLASEDGKVFFATSGGDLYKIDTTLSTEAKVGAMPASQTSAMECLGSHTLSYLPGDQSLAPINEATGQAEATPAPLNLGNLGSIMFTPTSQDPTQMNESYD